MKNPKRSTTFAMEWYIDNRMEYLEKKLNRLRPVLEEASAIDYDAIRDFMETKGRLKELQHMRQRLMEIGED